MDYERAAVVCEDKELEDIINRDIVRGVLREFQAFCALPHGSGNEMALARLFQERFADMGYVSHIDDACNLVCDIPASPGYERAPVLMLQGHLDMVCAVREGSSYDPKTDGIELYAVRDRETGRPVLCSGGDSSLGADCGIGVSAALWALFGGTETGNGSGQSPEAEHGPLRLVLTSQEETGLVGAKLLDKSALDDVTCVVNVDGFACGRVVAGSAGGMRVTYVKNAEFVLLDEWIAEYDGNSLYNERCDADADGPAAGAVKTAGARPAPEELTAVKLSASGFRGGHSGYDIDKGRANAIKLIAGFLRDMRDEGVDFALADFNGGLKHNVIPGEAEAVIVMRNDDIKKYLLCKEKLERRLTEDYADTDGEGVFRYMEAAVPYEVLTREAADALIDFTDSVFNGVYRYMAEMPDVADTSSNLGRVRCRSGEPDMAIEIFQRSMDKSFCGEVLRQREKCAERAGFTLTDSEEYEPWAFDSGNPLLEMAVRAYDSAAGMKAERAVSHVGLEPSVFSEKKDSLTMVSLGADVADAHTIRERVYIDSIEPLALTIREIVRKVARLESDSTAAAMKTV